MRGEPCVEVVTVIRVLLPREGLREREPAIVKTESAGYSRVLMAPELLWTESLSPLNPGWPALKPEVRAALLAVFQVVQGQIRCLCTQRPHGPSMCNPRDPRPANQWRNVGGKVGWTSVECSRP